MEIKSIKLAYFSPTGTTKKVVKAVGEGIGNKNAQLIDVTKPEIRKEKVTVSSDELFIVGIPVYMGRVPEVIHEWLNGITADNTPTVCVAVYGNRAYDDALIELADIIKPKGCVPVACAGFIGEHSFASDQRPIANGRPDADDLNDAKAFGEKISEMLSGLSKIDSNIELEIPGNHSYRDGSMWDVDFIEVSDACNNCGACIKVCPVEAIDKNDVSKIDVEKCITCCACIKVCPQNAKFIKPSKVMDASVKLNSLFSERCEPDCHYINL